METFVHQWFPSEIVSDYLFRMTNKGFQAYSRLYSFQNQLYNENKPLKEPSRECKKLNAEITKEWEDCFKEKLGPQDRMRDPTELNACLEAGQIVPCGTEPSKWSSKAFPVPKGDGKSVRIVKDFKKLNQEIERCHWPTKRSGQLLRHIDPEASYFVSLDLTSGYHQIKVDEESSNLLVISTPMGRYKFTVLAQAVIFSTI